MAKPRASRVRHGQEWWEQALQRQSDSGLSIRQFCFEEGVSDAAFYAWRKRLKVRSGDRRRTGRAKQSQRDLFLPVRVTDSPMCRLGPGEMELVLRRGVVVRLGRQADIESLRGVLSALEGSRC